MAAPAYADSIEDLSRDICDRLDLVDIASRYTSLKKQRGGYRGRCPFHQEDTPSFSIFEKSGTQFFKCWGANCGKTGTVIQFIQYAENLDPGAAFKRAREMALGLIAKPKPRRMEPQEPAGWQHPDWQAFAEEILAAARKNMTHERYTAIMDSRGLEPLTVNHFEVGWTGPHEVRTRVKIGGQERYFVVKANCWIFPVRDPDGRIRMLKWRDPQKKKGDKYGQLAGGTNGIFNLAAVKEQPRVIICTGEFDAMSLWQAGIEACCGTGGEATHFDIDKTFGPDKPVYYIADNDEPGRAAAKEKQRLCPRMKVAHVDAPFKDPNEQLVKKGLSAEDVAGFFTRADEKRPVKRKARRVELKSSQREHPTVELEEARVELADKAWEVLAHWRKYRGQVVQVKAQPGVGKGHAWNGEATRSAQEGHTIAWAAPRLAMYKDQERDPDWWKQILGRKAARDADGNPCDFDSPYAIEPGTCTVEGEQYHRTLLDKGWGDKSHEYCTYSCPLKSICEESGYLSALKQDGKNAFMTFPHMFTNTPAKFRSLVIDEPRYQDFLNITEVSDNHLRHLSAFTSNHGMLALNTCLREMLNPDLLICDVPIKNLTGREFYQELDRVCREKYRTGLLALLDECEEAGGWANWAVWDLLQERNLNSAEKLPPNVWQLGDEPGTGGIYDIIHEEAKGYLEGGMLDFTSRLELVKGEKGGHFVLYRRNYLPAHVGAMPVTVLDATGDTGLLSTLLSNWENIQQGDKVYRRENPIWKKRTPLIHTVGSAVELPSHVEVVQDIRRNYSKTALLASLKGNRRYWNTFVATLLEHLKPGEDTLIVCSMGVEDTLKRALAEKGATAANGYNYVVEHYGNLRGSNAHKQRAHVIEAGMYMPETTAIVAAGKALYAGDPTPIDDTLDYSEKLYRIDQEGYSYLDDVIGFKDSRLQKLLEQEREDEHLQVAYRIRPLDATEPKRITLLFGIPLEGLRVNRIISDTGEASQRSRLALEGLVAAAKQFLDDSTGTGYFTADSLAKETGKSTSTVYKYFDQVCREVGAEYLTLECTAPMPGGKKRAATFKLGISRELINILIITREIPGILPKGWKITEEQSRNLEALVNPTVEVTPISPREDLPEPVETAQVPRAVAGRVSCINNFIVELRKAFIREMARGNRSRAATARELAWQWAGKRDRLVKLHKPRGKKAKAPPDSSSEGEVQCILPITSGLLTG